MPSSNGNGNGPVGLKPRGGGVIRVKVRVVQVQVAAIEERPERAGKFRHLKPRRVGFQGGDHAGEAVGGQYIDLRNLGPQRTLVLVNGKRLGITNDGLQDVASIPSAMVERIEVLKDGASTIYGSDAIAGVINMELKKARSGGSITAQVGAENDSPQTLAEKFVGAVEQLIALREVYVATLQDQVVATASLDGGVVRSVFVSPDYQRRGVGQQLMRKLEAVAQARGLGVLSVPSSITAQAFYRRLGFSEVRDELHGAERTIIMQKRLPASTA